MNIPTLDREIDALLAQLEVCATYAEYMPLRSRCVQALDSYRTGVGVGPNRAAQWKEFERICRKVGPAMVAQVDALSNPKQKDAA